MNNRIPTNISLSELSRLPAYASYLLRDRLDEFIDLQENLVEELDLPMLRFFRSLPPDQYKALSRQGSVEFLEALAQKDGEDFIARSVRNWKENQLPVIDKYEIVSSDLAIYSYLRKQALLHFVPGYESSVTDAMALASEIDYYFMRSQSAMTDTYIHLLAQKVNEHALFTSKVNETIPGAVYVFDLEQSKSIYSNNKMAEVTGHTSEELGNLAPGAFLELVHPDDRTAVRRHLQDLKGAHDSEVKAIQYRIRNRAGEYRWISTHESVFRRDPAGKATQTIGITLDADQEQRTAAALRESQFVYRQAEQLANMGNWSWDLVTNELKWTDHLFRIYGLEPQSETLTLERFLSFVHPDDRAYVEGGTGEVFENDILDYTFRIITQQGQVKILRSVAQVHRDENGQPIRIVGTERDVTEKQNLINRLRKSENLYKQAQALAHMGNWSWDMERNIIEWSDELYRIYGREPQSATLDYEQYLQQVHPDDLELVQRQVDHAAKTGESWEYTHRIVRGNGEVRIVAATGEVLRDENGRPHTMIGTAQDVTERQNLIDRLQESEKLSRQAQSLAGLGSWTHDLRTNEFTWSDEMYNIYEVERTVGPMSFDKWLSFASPEDREGLTAYYRECLTEKKPYDRIHRITLHNGKRKTIHRKGELVFDKNGEMLRMIGTTQDITEEYRVQQELKDNQTFIRKIADATPSIIASYNVNTGKYVFISEGLQKLLGYSPALVLEKGVEFFAAIIHPDDVQELMARNAEAMEEANREPARSDMVVEFTYRMRNSAGDYRWFHTYGTIFDRNADGRVEHVLNISLDVTDQMVALEKIKEQEHFIQQIADASPTILYLYNVETQSIQYINREIFFVLGYLPEEIIDAGAGITDMLYHADDHQLLPGRNQSGKTFQQIDSMIQYECRMRSKDGDWRWLLVREIVFKTDEEGNIAQILGAALDINRRKDMEKTILQNTLLLEQSNASLEEFAYVASHDLKEPLRKISTFGDRLMAMQSANLAPEGKVYLQKIVDASQRMQTMISDLLSISMITGNRAFEKQSLQAIYEETLQTLEFKIEQLNAVITSEPLPEANIIPSQFRQLFQNLLSNSLKFVRPGVQPRIHIDYQLLGAQDMTHYQLAPAPGYHRLRFADNGIGFENEFAGKIFAIFQRLHGRSEYEGSGIGLAICKKIVEHHGGIIYANGVPDEGATFTIILPA